MDINIIHDLAIPLEIYPIEIKHDCGDLCKNVYCSIVFSSKNWKQSEFLWLGKGVYKLWCIHNARIIFSHWKEWVKSLSVDSEASRQYFEWEKQNSDNNESPIFVYTYMCGYCVFVFLFYRIKEPRQIRKDLSEAINRFAVRLVCLCCVPRRKFSRKRS